MQVINKIHGGAYTLDDENFNEGKDSLDSDGDAKTYVAKLMDLQKKK